MAIVCVFRGRGARARRGGASCGLFCSSSRLARRSGPGLALPGHVWLGRRRMQEHAHPLRPCPCTSSGPGLVSSTTGRGAGAACPPGRSLGWWAGAAASFACGGSGCVAHALCRVLYACTSAGPAGSLGLRAEATCDFHGRPATAWRAGGCGWCSTASTLAPGRAVPSKVPPLRLFLPVWVTGGCCMAMQHQVCRVVWCKFDKGKLPCMHALVCALSLRD